MVCTTGLSEELQLKVVQLSRSIPVFKSANMSMGINVLSELCKRASAILGVNYDVEIVEQHHHNKLDAPSGTALMLADAINEENDGAYHYVYDLSLIHISSRDDTMLRQTDRSQAVSRKAMPPTMLI